MAGERERAEQIAGSNIVPYNVRKEVKAMDAQNRLYTQAIESGKTEEEAKRIVAESGIGSATPKLDRMAGEQRRAEEARGGQPDLGGFKTYGDKSTFEAKNAVRALRGLEPLAAPLEPQKQFQVDLEKSASFGAESALTGQKGQARAFEAGIRAGYSPDETRKLISDTAARITGIVDQQKEQTTETPKSPAKLPFFEQVYEQFRSPVPATTTPAASQTTVTPKSPAKLPFFEQVYEQFRGPAPATTTPAASQTTVTPKISPVNPQNMTTTEGVVSAGMRGAVGGIPTSVLRNAMSTAGELFAPLAQTHNFLQAAEQLDFVLGKKRNQK